MLQFDLYLTLYFFLLSISSILMQLELPQFKITDII